MLSASEERKRLRPAEIAGDVSRFFARYKSPPTADKIKADARRFKKSLDPYAFKRIIAAADKLAAIPAARPAPPPNASIYFDTPGTPGAGTAQIDQATNAPSGDLDPLPFILGAIGLFFLLRR